MNKLALEKLLKWMDERNFLRFFIIRPENFSWLTGGDNTVIAGEGVAWIEICEGKLRVHTSKIEAQRLLDEEIPGMEISVYPWYEMPQPREPNDLQYDLTALRLVLSFEEQERFQVLGRDAAQAVSEAIRSAKPSWTESEMAGAVAEACYSRGIQPVVLLVAGEERIFKYRHPLPKEKLLGSVCMVVLCGKRQGLIANLTRIRSFGNAKVQQLYYKVLEVEAVALKATTPGATLGEVLEAIKGAYTNIGMPQAFEEHHQGGIAGYRPREVVARPGDKTQLEVGMAVAWNPSIPGAKVEDTFLLTPSGLLCLTCDPDWPVIEFGQYKRPALLLE